MRIKSNVAFQENYLGIMRRTHALVPNENGYAEVPPMKLFPAATVLVEVLTKDRISIWPRWIIDKARSFIRAGGLFAALFGAFLIFAFAWH